MQTLDELTPSCSGVYAMAVAAQRKIVEFLCDHRRAVTGKEIARFWYSQEEPRYRLDTFRPKATIERDYLVHALKTIEEESSDPRVEACLEDIRSFIAAHKIDEIVRIAEDIVAIRERLKITPR